MYNDVDVDVINWKAFMWKCEMCRCVLSGEEISKSRLLQHQQHHIIIIWTYTHTSMIYDSRTIQQTSRS